MSIIFLRKIERYLLLCKNHAILIEYFTLKNKNMGLFDDLLGGGSKNTAPQDTTPIMTDPMAGMPQGTTSTPPAIDELLNISAGNVTADMPSYTVQKAAESQNIVTEAAPAIEITATESPIIISDATEVAPVVETTPVTTDAPSSLIAETPVVAPSTSENLVTETPVISLLDETPMTETSVTEVVAPEVATPEISLISEENHETAEKAAESGLFSLVGQDLESAQALATETSVENTENSSIFASSETETLTTEIPENTDSFLNAGLLQLEKMEKALADRKQKFLDQADRSEKEKFAKLEAEALENSRSMDDEQDRIDTMKKYFKKQQEGANINDSVGTALTGIGVKNAVGKTINRKTRTPAKQSA